MDVRQYDIYSECWSGYLTIGKSERFRGWLHGDSVSARAENLFDYMGNFSRVWPPSWNWTRYLRDISHSIPKTNSLRKRGKFVKMATENLRKIVMLSFFQFGLLITLILQWYGVVIAYKLLQTRRNSLLCAYLWAKRKKWQNRKHLKIPRLCRISMHACTTHARNNSSPGWNDYIRNVSCFSSVSSNKAEISVRAETESGLKLLSYNRTRYFITRPGWNSARAKNSPCNQSFRYFVQHGLVQY